MKPLAGEQVARWRPGLQQVRGDVPLVHGSGDDAPGPDDAGAEVGLDRQPEPVEPLGVRGVAAEPGREPVRPGPAIGAADPGGVLDRDRAGAGLLAVIFGQAGRQQDPYLLERAPQPAGTAG